MRRFGLIGFPLTHSFSKKFFSNKFEREHIDDCEYENYPIEHISQLQDLIKNTPNLVGINVTIPYKKEVIPYLTQVSPIVQNIGACNCILLRNGARIGFNTDVPGFKHSLEPYLQPHHQRAIVLGTGGASAAVVYVLAQLHIPFIVVSRKAGEGTISYEQLTEKMMHSHHLIINTTPLGTFPNITDCPPIPYSGITSKHHLYDLVYNPAETVFLQRGKSQGATVQNGMDMLIEQALESWRIWNEAA